MRVAFIHYPYAHKKCSENIRVVNEEFCIAPPLVLAYVAAIARKAGHEVMLIDAHNHKLGFDDIADRLRPFHPDLLCFRAETYHFHDMVACARILKKTLSVPVLVGGINISYYPQESFSHQVFDYGLQGEVLETLPLLLSRLASGKQPKDIPGALYYDKNVLQIEPLSEQYYSFDDYPFPARDLLDNTCYGSIISQRKNFTIMLTTTGCPFECTFCAARLFPYRERSIESVMQEIEECYIRYHVREIDFFDSVFAAHRTRTEALCDALISRQYDLEWSCRARVDMLDDSLIAHMKRAGCRQIYVGIEAHSAEVLAKTKKNITHHRVQKTLDSCRHHGVKTMGFFMMGNVGDTEETLQGSIDYAVRLPLNFAQFTIAIAKPYTEYDTMRIKETGRDYWREYIAGTVSDHYFPNPWSVLSYDTLVAYAKKAYVRFYFRPEIFIRSFLSIKSMAEWWRYVRVGMRMLLLCLGRR